MGKEPKPISQTEMLKKHAAALDKHAKELKFHSQMLAAHTAAMAPDATTQFVYGILGVPLTLPVTTLLSKIGLNPAALAATASDINNSHWHGVQVDTGLIQACKTIKAIIDVVAAAEH